MRRRGIALALTMGVIFGSPIAAGSTSDIADGFINGREHEVRLRSVLGEVPKEAKKFRSADRTVGEAAIASCDPVQLAALGRKVPTTSRDGDDPAACVVVDTPNDKKSERLLLGPARLTGSELALIALKGARKGRQSVVAQLSDHGETLWAFHVAQVGDADLAVTLDGQVVDLAPIGENGSALFSGLSVVLGSFTKDDAAELRGLLEQSEREEVIELAREASLSRRARTLFAGNNPQIRDKGNFARDCPLPESDDTFALGCYDSFSQDIAVLRVERPDLAGVMPVTAAHEMLHAAYEELRRKARKKIDSMIEDFLVATPQPDIEAELEVYSARDRANEVHSLIGTEVRVLTPALEKYYDKFFDDRAAVVTLFEGYEAVFKALEVRFATLTYELAALNEQLISVEGQANAAGNEADSLANQIDNLRAQGRIDESNALVGPQNAAVNRANSLVNQYNSLVAQYNAKVAELNATGISLNDLYSEFDPSGE
jgi:hypothetical protein